MQGFLGATIRKARTDLGLSQGAVGRALGFSSEFISLLEADKRAPSIATLNQIAAYLSFSLSHIVPKFSLCLRLPYHPCNKFQ